jgi:hypothetical protein
MRSRSYREGDYGAIVESNVSRCIEVSQQSLIDAV